MISKITYPEFLDSKYIYAYNRLNDELKSLIEHSGFKLQFVRKFNKSLRFLENLRSNCTEHSLFERLDKIIFSIMLKGQKNIRILFSFFNKEGQEIVILLNCFQEKEKATSKSKEGYSKNIEVAYKRINKLKDFKLNVSGRLFK